MLFDWLNRISPSRWLAPLLLLGLSTQASELPDIGRSAATAVAAEEDRRLGEELVRWLRQNRGLMEDPLVRDYLNNLGYRIVANSDDPSQSFTFYAIRDSSINAFAAPGGVIGINSGLILTTHSESELAAVVSHEIAHITQRHRARAFEAARRQSIASAVAALAILLIGQNSDQTAGAAIATGLATNVQQQINFTRAHETEADQVGIRLLARSGFDPFSMARVFQRMHQASRVYGSGPPEFLRTHPVTDNRVAEATGRAEKFAKQDVQENANYHFMRARVRVLGSDDLHALEREIARGLKNGSYRHLAAERYAYALCLTATRNYQRALKELDRLPATDQNRIAIRLLRAELARDQGETDRALALFEKSLLLYPNNHALTIGYATTLLQANQAQRARQVLQGYLRSRPAVAEDHRLLARIADATGSPGEAHLAMAEYHHLHGDTRAAIDQLERASRLKNLDYYQSSRITARLERLKQEAREREKE